MMKLSITSGFVGFCIMSELKKCTVCKDYKNKSLFGKDRTRGDGLNCKCKECQSAVGKTHYKKYKEKILKRTREYGEKHKERRAITSKAYELRNKERRLKQRRIRDKKRKLNDPLYRLMKRLRNLTYNSLKRKGYSKKTRTYEIIGLSKEDLLIYLNNNKYGFRFEDGIYDLDHIIAVMTAESEEEIIKLCHYTNLQLLPSEYNRNIKSDNPWNQTHFENWLLKNPQNSAL